MSMILSYYIFICSATNPSQFEIEFFVNDLSKRGAGTFESVGCLQYNQHGKIHMDFEKKVMELNKFNSVS